MDIDYREGHMILGGLLVLVCSPFFAHAGLLTYIYVVLIPLFSGGLLEIAQWRQWYPHEPTTLAQSLNDISEWVFGGLLFSIFIALTKYL